MFMQYEGCKIQVKTQHQDKKTIVHEGIMLSLEIGLDTLMIILFFKFHLYLQGIKISAVMHFSFLQHLFSHYDQHRVSDSC